MKTHVTPVDDFDRPSIDIRILPIGGGSNVYVGLESFLKEMEYRRERIKEGASFELPEWNALKKVEESL